MKRNIIEEMHSISLRTTAEYVIENMYNITPLTNWREIHNKGIEQISDDGLILEFGVYSGDTINHIAKQLPNRKVHGFDSFEGLPENWKAGFDKGRFAATFPNLIRFLHTACVYLETEKSDVNVPPPAIPFEEPILNSNMVVNHLNFVKGEILSRPVAVTHNNGVIIGDRLVVGDDLQLIFYDAIVINREKENQKLFTVYEDFMTLNRRDVCYLVLLGTENF